MTAFALPVMALLLSFNPAAVSPRTGFVNPPRAPAEVRTAILTGIRDRGWVVQNETPEIITRLDHRGVSIAVAIGYESNRYVIRALECSGNEKHYDKYVSNLEASIRKAVAHLASQPLQQQQMVQQQPPPPPPPPGAAGQAGPPPSTTPPPALAIFAREQRPENVRTVILNSLAAHKWVVEQEDRNGIVARQTTRTGNARIRVTGTTQQATISYLDSTGIDIDAQTGRSNEYEKWMRSLISAFETYTQKP
jgi:hypothetical protein